MVLLPILYNGVGYSPPPKKNSPFPLGDPAHDLYIVTSQFTTQTASRLVQSLESAYTLQSGGYVPRKNFFPLSSGGPCPDQTHCYFGPPQSTTRTASRSVQPFLQVSWLCRPSNRQTDTHTNRPRYTDSNRPHLCSALRCIV